MALNLFRPQYRTIQNPVNLDVLANTYNTLENKHLQALELRAKYGEALQALPLHPNEDAWVAQRQQDIKNAFNDNLRYGNAAASLDDLVRTWGDIKGDPAMKGRLRANQEYQNYMANLEANKTLDEDTKAYYREKNKYYYQDTYDNTGNIIGGTEWKPLEREVNHVPINLIFEQALKWAAKEGGMGNSVMFLDANGRPTADYSQSITGEMYANIAGKWEKLSPDKVKEAINAAFESIPGAKASFEQQYKVANWKYEHGKSSDITDRNGVRMTKDQYLASKITPFINAVTYHNSYNSITYGDAWKSQLAAKAAVQNRGNVTMSANDLKGLTSVTGDLIRVKNNAPVEAQAEITDNRQKLAEIINSGSGEKLDLHNATSEQIERAIFAIQDPNLRAQAASYNLKIKDAQDYINSISEGKVEKPEFKLYNAIMSMSDLPQGDETEINASKQYTNRIDNLYGSGEAIRKYFTNDQLQQFKTNIGVDNILKSGIVIGGDKNGNNYVQLNKGDYGAAYTFAKGVQSVDKGLFDAIFNSDSTKFTRIQDGQEVEVEELAVGLGNLVNYVNSLERASNRVLDGGEIFKSNIAIASPTPAIAELDILINNGVDVSNNKSRRDALYKQFVDNTIPNIAITQSSGYILDDDTRTYRQMTSEEALENTKILRSDIAKDLKYSIVPDPINGDACIQVTVPGELESNKYSAFAREPRSFIIGSTGINNPEIKRWNDTSEWRSMNKLNKYADAGRPLSLTTDVVFNNIPNVKFTPNGMNNIMVSIDGVNIANVDRGTARSWLKPIIEVQQLAEYSKYNTYPDAQVRPLVRNAAVAIATMSGKDEGAVDYYESIIMQNLGY